MGQNAIIPEGFVAPTVGERPIDRFVVFGNFVMVIGEPDNNMFGKPVFREPTPARFQDMMDGTFVAPPGETDDAVFGAVKAHRKGK
jgi:hypothetical protein